MTVTSARRDGSGLPQYAQEFLIEAMRASGKYITIQTDAAVGRGFALTEYAHHYAIVVSPKELAHETHLSIQAAAHILRRSACPANKLLIAEPTKQDRGREGQHSANNEVASRSIRICNAHERAFWAHLASKFAITIPTDIRIENELQRQFPEHRSAQVRFLRAATHWQDRLIDLVAKEGGPSDLYRIIASYCAISIAAADRLGGANACPNYRTGAYERLGSGLISRDNLDPATGHLGDIIFVDRCAARIGAQQFYRWQTTNG